MTPNTDSGRRTLHNSAAITVGSSADASAAGDVAAIRAAIYRDTCDDKALAAALEKHPRTIARYIARGMPVIRGPGREKRFNVERVRAWMLANEHRHGEVRRGRPRKHAA